MRSAASKKQDRRPPRFSCRMAGQPEVIQTGLWEICIEPIAGRKYLPEGCSGSWSNTGPGRTVSVSIRLFSSEVLDELT
jgi:hypothetical protein